MDPFKLRDAWCRDERRPAAIREHPSLNGIDSVEYERRPAAPIPNVLVVTFLKPLPQSGTDGAYELTSMPQLVRVHGGKRIVGVEVLDVRVVGARLEIDLDREGDFSLYWLTIGWLPQTDGTWLHQIPELDPRFSLVPINFKAGCPSEFDCRAKTECPPEDAEEPVIDYTAKDYASFRLLLLDLIPLRNPGWLERNPADLGMTLVELLAYAGDHLSYFQDAVATEAYLDTCRQRVSAKRHARLIDYRMHEGRNAWTFVHFEVGDAGKVVEAGTPVFSRVVRALRGKPSPPPTVIPSADLDFDRDPALQGTSVFETTARLVTDRRNNFIFIHTWGNAECCLPQGSTEVYLYTTANPASSQVVRPPLQEGEYLLLEEVRGVSTGLPADADPRHRQVVRISEVEDAVDPVWQDQLLGEQLQPITSSLQAPLPLLRVTFSATDALTFPLCLSINLPGAGDIRSVSVARGNVIPADHGRSVEEDLLPPSRRGGETAGLETRLSRGPLTFQAMPQQIHYDQDGKILDPRHDLERSPREVEAAVTLVLRYENGDKEVWTPVPHLLDSPPFEPHFVVDLDDAAVATLRFGDGEYGRQPADVAVVHERYRIGNGRAGNVGAESLVHAASPQDPAALAAWPAVVRVRQPLGARNGVDPETIEEVRQFAPQAFHAEQFRAVTEEDYERAALKLSSIAAAKCTFHWTGSWHTVFVAIHPRNASDVITEPGGRTRLAEPLALSIRNHLIRCKIAGYDFVVRTAQYVPLKIMIQLCVARGHFRGDVLEAAGRALSNRRFADGTVGFFHPSRFTFGQPVYLSRLYSALKAVEGVDSAEVRVFQRYWEAANGELERGAILMSPAEIPRLDNDPNFMENGVLRLSAVGGL
jgi:hypothetical protein